eukprot:gnl/MRDRNA2_/MRDRNA2_48863_c0_seq1.p1 gnl/MRDRNA2_/MRDRNA2_48863_c0~~gnl/MRDRNA2_/MRDRNA2_48863_c0_seq1.p1  ORF type:complete len:543 (-),score=109.88 gnl/MRDRNA2_/MRDRNA2_48863_c0_seq1:141-1619(-)
MYHSKQWCLLLQLIGAALAKPEDNAACDFAVVGAGAGGAYAAWNMAAAGKKVCIFEMADRPGGRIHSLRQQGPKKDLVVEAGAYRFAEHEVCEPLPGSNQSWCIFTPIIKATVEKLGLKSAVYDPDPKEWDHNLRKLVDTNGHAVGYLTLVEAMLDHAVKLGAELKYNTKVLGLGGNSSDIQLHLANGDTIHARSVLLNLPQDVLLKLLRKSEGPITDFFPAPLYKPSSFPIMKLYVHYEDAWWRNDLGLLTGPFVNSNPGLNPPVSPHQAPMVYEAPAPLQGQYHDGDVRCDLPGGKCRGFLQAFYNGGVGVDFYKNFHPWDGDAAVQLSPSTQEHKELLTMVHNALVEFHRDALDKVNATARVEKMLPDAGVMSIWSQGVEGIHAGCHMPKIGNHSSSAEIAREALKPFAGWPLYVANEAFGPHPCWAEGSLNMSAAAVQHLGVQLQHPVPTMGSSRPPPPMDPFLMMDHRAYQSRFATHVAIKADDVLI